MIDLKNPAYDYGDEYAFGEDVECIIPTIKHDIRPVGNQGKNAKTKSACTIVGAVNQIIRLFGIQLSEAQTNKLYCEVVDYCTKYGYVIGSGWGTPTAIDTVRKFWNEIGYKTFNTEKVFTKRLLWNNAEIEEALDKGHLVGYTKNLHFGEDQVNGLVYRSKYPTTTGHRLNWKGIKYTKATGGADISEAERGSQDNYHGAIGENFAFKEVKPYINHGVYAYGYLILPVSCSINSIEKNKELIEKQKAYHVLISAMSSTYNSIENEFQMMSGAYATALRDKTNERPVEHDEVKKAYQLVVDSLSYAWKYAGEEEQKMYSELAEHLRKKFGVK